MAIAAALSVAAPPPLALWSAQQQVHDALRYTPDAKHVIGIWGRGAGKTEAALAVAKSSISGPGVRDQLVVYVGPSYNQARSIFWRRLLKAIPAHFLKPGHAVYEDRLELKLRNGCEVWLRGAERVNSLRGVSINRLIIDEYQACTAGEDVFHTLEPSLRTSRDKALILGTPNGPDHFQKLFRRVEKLKGWLAIKAPTWAAPHADLEKLRAMLSVMDRQSWAQEYGAEFIAVSGAIYKEFNRDLHVRATPPLAGVPFLVGHDFNASFLTAIVCQVEGSNLRVCGEVITKSSLHEHHRNLSRWFEDRGLAWRDPELVSIRGDASGMFQGTNSRTKGQADSLILKGLGWDVRSERHNPRVLDRVHSLASLILAADGKTVRLSVDPSCEYLLSCLEAQVWNKYGNPDKQRGLDHGPDALGYAAWTAFPIREIRELSIGAAG